ncbi:MAG: ComEA family DNA-binding protein [Clostridia bacterium]|nr:ComEA family DNA-binding protein [Clostridia bacterium]
MRIRFFGRIIVIPLWLKYGLIGLVFVILSVAGFFISREAQSGVVGYTERNEETVSSLPADRITGSELPALPSATPEVKYITVYIVGAVAVSDVYDLPEGSILNELVALAGGFAEGADREAVNLAAELSNGMMIRIPFKSDKEKNWIVDGGTSSSAKITEGGLVNINTASVSELCTLPGVGESTALKIISYRTENGPFGSISDIMNVGGIKTAKFNEIKNYITVGK